MKTVNKYTRKLGSGDWNVDEGVTVHYVDGSRTLCGYSIWNKAKGWEYGYYDVTCKKCILAFGGRHDDR